MAQALDPMPPLGGSALLRRIEADLPRLSPQLRKVAAHLLRERGLSHRHRITDLAGLCGAAPVTIVRLAKRYGFKGFCDLKFAFLEEAGAAAGAADGLLTGRPVLQASAAQQALEAAVRCLQALRPLVEHPGFKQAADWLHEADGVWVSGRQPADAAVAGCLILGLQQSGLLVRPGTMACHDGPAGRPGSKPLHLHVALASPTPGTSDISAAMPPAAGRRIVLLRSPQPGIACEGLCLTLGIGPGAAGQALPAAVGLLAAWAGVLSCLRKNH